MSSYRDLVRVTGPGFLILSFLARLPAAMGPLGIITLVAVATGSFATAGAVAAAYGIGAAVGGPIVGGLADRYGQRLVGILAALIDAAALAGVVIAVQGGAVPVVIALVAAAAGFASPQVGPLVRVRWAALLGDRGAQRILPTAFSYEGAADELSFMAGPALVGLIAMFGSPSAPLLVAAALTVIAAMPFALHRTAPPVVRAPRATAVAARVPIGAVVALVAAMVAIGAVFGATQTGVTAFASSVGASGSAGLIYAVLGVGSAVAGLATAGIPARIGLLTRYLGAAIALAVGGVLLVAMPGSLGGVLAAMAVIGVVSAPYLISVYAVASAITPARRAGMIMTLLASGVGAGVAGGAALAGRLADAYGYPGAFAVPMAAGAFGVVVALTTLPTLRQPLRPTTPGRNSSRVGANNVADLEVSRGM